jgi:hypothetical protein
MNGIDMVSVIQVQYSIKRGTIHWNSFTLTSSGEYTDMLPVYVECNQNASEAKFMSQQRFPKEALYHDYIF